LKLFKKEEVEREVITLVKDLVLRAVMVKVVVVDLVEAKEMQADGLVLREIPRVEEDPTILPALIHQDLLLINLRLLNILSLSK
jgi:hypothetical protein